jgi:uncharacterized membrane protein
MQLPEISIPLTLPFEVPVMLHPVVVHFAFVLPIVVLLLELSNLAFKRRALSVASLAFLLLAVGVFLASYFTGKADGSEAFDLLGEEARGELKAHRLLGTYLVYALLIPVVFKLMAMILAQKWARGALIVTLVMFISFVAKQGYDGGELVYKYGVNVAPVTEAREAVEDMNTTIAEQNATIGELKAELEALKAKEEKGVGEAVNEAVNEAVSKVKEMLVEANATVRQLVDANDSSAATNAPVETNETNGTL